MMQGTRWWCIGRSAWSRRCDCKPVIGNLGCSVAKQACCCLRCRRMRRRQIARRLLRHRLVLTRQLCAQAGGAPVASVGERCRPRSAASAIHSMLRSDPDMVLQACHGGCTDRGCATVADAGALRAVLCMVQYWDMSTCVLCAHTWITAVRHNGRAMMFEAHAPLVYIPFGDIRETYGQRGCTARCAGWQGWLGEARAYTQRVGYHAVCSRARQMSTALWQL